MRSIGKYCTFPARSGKRARTNQPPCSWAASGDVGNVLARQFEPLGHVAHMPRIPFGFLVAWKGRCMIIFAGFSDVSAGTGSAWMECIFGQETGYTGSARRNNSLSTSNRMFAFGFIALIARVIALALAWLGPRLILPFAGIELRAVSRLALYRAPCTRLRTSNRRAAPGCRPRVGGTTAPHVNRGLQQASCR